MTHRREFLRQFSQISAGLALAPGYWPILRTGETEKITILHTNDMHSRIDPFPKGAGKLAGKGGAAARSAFIERVRSEEKHVILLDSGDIWQGTPYFNAYEGRLEFELMSQMRYDAATLGNHDFDLGLDGLKKQRAYARFPFICTNYDFSDTQLAGLCQKYEIITKGRIRIGIIGLGIDLAGLVPHENFRGLQIFDPVIEANRWAKKLKREKNCDWVIALSHLGYEYASDKISDRKLARKSEDIDLILGGHTHTFLDGIQTIVNKKGKAVAINQVGFGGAMVGRIDLWFNKKRKKTHPVCQNCWV